MPASPYLLEPQDLHALLGSPGVLIVDLSEPEAYAQGHIPGAVHLPYSALVRAEPPAMGLLPDTAALSAALGAIGVTPDTHVVACDGEGTGRACRLLWTLDVLGQRRWSLLNGGVPAWRSAGLALTAAPSEVSPSRYHAELSNPRALALRDEVLAAIDAPDTVLVDTRSRAEYEGADVRAARGGHIPGAINYDWTSAMDPARDLRLLPDARLRAEFEARGVTPDREVIVYCQTHHRSAHTYVVLRHLGYPRVRGYAGAWSEWGNDPALPVE